MLQELIRLQKTNNSINDSKQKKGMQALSFSKKTALLRGTASKYHGDFYCL